jgi:hypothetical protein
MVEIFEPVAIFLPATEVEGVARPELEQRSDALFGERQLPADIHVGDARLDSSFGCGTRGCRNRAATERHVVPEPVREQVRVSRDDPEIDLPRGQVFDNPRLCGGVPQTLRERDVDVVAETLAEREPGGRVDLRGDRVGVQARSRILDAAQPQRVESNRSSREAKHFTRKVADHLRPDERRVCGTELIERAPGQQQRGDVGLPETLRRHVHLRCLRRPCQRHLDVVTGGARRDVHVQLRLNRCRADEIDRARRVARNGVHISADEELAVIAQHGASRHRGCRGGTNQIEIRAELRPRVVVVDDEILIRLHTNIQRELFRNAVSSDDGAPVAPTRRRASRPAVRRQPPAVAYAPRGP